MNHLYHGAPEPMEGSLLLPLSDLKTRYPDLYKLHAAKYEGREEIMERRIPFLDCLWTDVVQLLPIHPKEVFGLQKELGLIPDLPPLKFFEIDPRSLDPNKTVVFFKTAPGEENTFVKWLRDVDLATLQDIPEATLGYYKSLVGTGELPFNYQFIPHVLHRGSIDISGSQIITL